MKLLTVVVLLIVFSAPAHAYVDLGSGSYMLQMALAGLLAVVFTLKLWWQRVKSFAVGLVCGRNRTESHG